MCGLGIMKKVFLVTYDIRENRMCERRKIMAETKKTAIVKPAAKAVAAKAADTKTEEVKASPVASAEEPKKAPAKKTAAAKKTTTKTTTKTSAKKAAEAEVVLQFAGKEYTNEDLVKIAKDVWKYDLKQKVGDFKSVKLYVKTEENKVYYVINGDVTGEFDI